jgi:DNA gyrase/topoisomerase IV subunit B
MYLGEAELGRSSCFRLLEGLVDAIADDAKPPREIRVRLWSDSVISVAYDGTPLPVEPVAQFGAVHPAILPLFMHLGAGAPPCGLFVFGPILNALSERLVVSTMRGDQRYRVVFARGMIVSLLQATACAEPPGITWFTFRPDTTIIGDGPVTGAELRAMAEREQAPRIVVEDHSGEEADWG